MTEICRRTVLTGAAATCGAALLAACSGGGSSTPAAAPDRSSGGGAPAPGGGVRASLGQVSDIPVGGAVEARTPDGTRVLLMQPSAGEVVALNASCPHEGCFVLPDGEQLTCPCHGSQFTLSGEVTRGPAESNLQPFPVRVLDGQVLPA